MSQTACLPVLADVDDAADDDADDDDENEKDVADADHAYLGRRTEVLRNQQCLKVIVALWILV
jgi:hypothetical protein